ncbi:MAG: long-chain fatty acid--CoA ligase [Deltaproteobacteria bacterium]|nr:MAG: long-chain fatty acid--CoA ligase [Deltaproteobacteria bacterium]
MASSYPSVAHMFLDRVEKTPTNSAFLYPDSSDRWQSITWAETGDRVRRIACGLRALGLEQEQPVAILCSTRLEWVLADLGICCAGGATSTIYPSSTGEESAFIARDSEAAFIFAENDEQVAKLHGVRDQMPSVRHVIVIDGAPSDDGWVLTLSQLEEKGRQADAEDPDAYERIARALTSDRLCTLIYTSGTTGRPKGVELIHDCWVFEGEAIEEINIIQPDHRQFLWLPLSHSFGKVLLAAQLKIGFETAIDGRIDRIVPNLGATKPDFVAAVPRIFEKVYNKIVQGARDAGGMKWKIFKFAMDTGLAYSREIQAGRTPKGLLALKYAVADKLVFQKVRQVFGGNLKCFISGSAPLSRDIAEFFHAAGMLILEGYGLTESSAASFVNRLEAFKFGTVGKALPGVDVRIDPADGEILLHGRGIMRGYHGLPEVTAETLTEDGWLRTGDIGELDADGFLRITDRKKDLIKTSGGKYVAPQALEGQLKVINPYISQVVVHGDRRNFCTALVALSREELPKWAEQNGLGNLSYAELVKHDKTRAMVQESIDKLNSGLASYETIKKFAILPEEPTVENGQLTPSLKLKRKVVEKQYMDILDGFYEGALADIK